MERNFPELIAAGALDETYNLFARQQFEKGSIEQGEIYLHKIKNRDLQRELYAYAAGQASHSASNKAKAAFYIKTAIDMTRKKDIVRSGYLLTSGQIQYAMGNMKAALSDVKASRSPKNFGSTHTQVYLQYLQEAGQYKTALKVAEGYIKSWPESSAIKSYFMKIYSKVKGNDAGAEERYQALIKIRDERLVPPKYNELDVPSINFTMNDIQGKPFTLSNLLGKSVVLYFFTVPKTARAAMSNEYFKKVAAEYQSSGDVVFVGIEKSYNQSISGPVAQAERVEKLKKYIEQNKITYQVIPDHWILGANVYGGHFQLSAEYSVNSPSQFFIID
ncbi:MAG: redoxin domain-containing protein, partial [Flavobacterium sp.]